MRLEIDARLLRGGGIGRYLREMAGRWLVAPDVDRIRFFGYPAQLDAWLAEADGRGIADIVPWEYPPYSPRAHAGWPGLHAKLRWRADVTFFPSHDAPLVGHPHPSVVAVHDLLHLEAPGFPAWKRVGARALLHSTLRQADRVITVSRHSANAIRAFEPSADAKLRVVENGVSDTFRPLSEDERGRRDRVRSTPFLLAVGPARAHKNLDLAVRVLAGLRARGSDHRLVLVTTPSPPYGPLLALADDLGVRSHVEILREISDAELRTLYATAEAVLVPSLAEGCGLPVLEGAACGARVLAADLPWAREVSAPGEPLLPPHDPLPWVDRIAELSRDGAPSPTPRLVRSWAAAAQETLDVLRSAAEDWTNTAASS